MMMFSGSAIAKSLNFVWNAYCPFTCQAKSTGQPGYAMEVVQAIFDTSDYQVKYTYVLSWNRAMSQVENGEKDAIVFSFHNPESAHLYVIPKEPLAIDQSTSFAIKKDNPWRLKNVDSLKALKHIGVYKGTIWTDKSLSDFEMNNKGKFVYLHGDNIVGRAFDMLRRGRLDAWEDSDTLLNYHMFKNRVDDLRIERSPKETRFTGDVLFSAKNPDSAEFAAYFSVGLKRLRKSGQLEGILQTYGLKDWQ